VCVHVRMYVYMCTYVCMYVFIPAYVYVCVFVNLYKYLYVCMHICISKHIYLRHCAYLCMHMWRVAECATHCNTLQHTATHCNRYNQRVRAFLSKCVAVLCIVLQCVRVAECVVYHSSAYMYVSVNTLCLHVFVNEIHFLECAHSCMNVLHVQHVQRTTHQRMMVCLNASVCIFVYGCVSHMQHVRRTTDRQEDHP